MATKKRKTKRPGSKKSANNKLSRQGSEIMRIAKRIRKANPKKKWITCVKEAGKEFKKQA